MANLKLDLIDKLNRDKMFEEVELVRLAQDANTNYREKIDQMSTRLANISIINAQLGLAQQYFQDQPPATPVPAGTPAGTPAGPPAGQVHPGQTHGE